MASRSRKRARDEKMHVAKGGCYKSREELVVPPEVLLLHEEPIMIHDTKQGGDRILVFGAKRNFKFLKSFHKCNIYKVLLQQLVPLHNTWVTFVLLGMLYLHLVLLFH